MAAMGGSKAQPGTSLRAQQWSVVIMSTLAFTVCFAIWMMFAVIGIPIKKMLDLNATQFGLLTATPVLTGSLIRVPLGMWTDKYGGRIVFFLLMIVDRHPDLADRLRDRVLAVPGAGPVRRPRRRLVLGRHAVRRALVRQASTRASRWGSSAPATRARPSTKFVAPAHRRRRSAGPWCRRSTRSRCWSPRSRSGSSRYSDPKHLVPAHITYRHQLAVLRDPSVWKYCQYYSIVFGGYVALSLWMTKYYVGEYGLDIRIAALLAACFSLPGGVLRAIGGWMSDKWGAHQVTWWVHVGELDLPVPARPIPQTELHGHDDQRTRDVHARRTTSGRSPS